MQKTDPDFSEKLKKYGAENFDTCYNCGNCTAVCSLTDEQANFPRIMIRYGLLGLKKEILSSKELWLCYACGDCSETCPRQADPGNYMSALRRYAISRYEPTGLTGMLFTSNPFAIAFTLLLAALLGVFLITLQPESNVSRWIFQYMSFEVIHDLGMILFLFTGVMIIIGLVRMILFLAPKIEKKGGPGDKKKFLNGNSLWQVLKELMAMSRHRKCDEEVDQYWMHKPWYVRPWFVHWSMMWGFIGLLTATTLDFIFKDPATDIWWPSRILGTLAGLLMMYGATLAIVYRLKKISASYQNTNLADWMFLVFLWLAGLTGFWLEIAVAIDAQQMIHHVVFVIHTIISMELVLLFTFSKFAHAIYRPIALFFYFRDRQLAV
jgi:ferredoxin